MAEIFISVNQSIDIDVKSGQFVINQNGNNDVVRILSTPSVVGHDGAQSGATLSIKTAQPYIQEVSEVIDSVLEYHGVDAIIDGNSIVIDDADYLADDTVEAIEIAVKGLNSYLK